MKRILTIIYLIIMLIHVAMQSNWETHKITIEGNTTNIYITKLDYAPLWDIPEVNDKSLILVQNWDFTLSQWMALISCYTAPIGIISIIFKTNDYSQIFKLLSSIGKSMMIGSIIVMILWIMVGGWGPIGIIPIGFICISVGIFLYLINKNAQQVDAPEPASPAR